MLSPTPPKPIFPAMVARAPTQHPMTCVLEEARRGVRVGDRRRRGGARTFRRCTPFEQEGMTADVISYMAPCERFMFSVPRGVNMCAGCSLSIALHTRPPLGRAANNTSTGGACHRCTENIPKPIKIGPLGISNVPGNPSSFSLR